MSLKTDVLSALEKLGPSKTDKIISFLVETLGDVHGPSINVTLSKLVKEGLATRLGVGVYGLTSLAPVQTGGAQPSKSKERITLKDISATARQVVLDAPGGIKAGELAQTVLQLLPGANENTVRQVLTKLVSSFPDEIYKPGHGLYGSLKDAGSPEIAAAVAPAPTSTKEADFYSSFAEWLESEDEATHACSLGGSGLKEKWGTPDVIGVYKAKATDRVKFQPQIVVAEIKINEAEGLTALGQAIAYRLFSHKVYVVMPSSSAERDLNKLEVLCIQLGLGLVTFTLDPAEPDYQMRVRARLNQPDYFYVNDFAERLVNHNAKTFSIVFG